MSYQFDDYKNIRLTPGYRNTRGVFHNRQGFRRSTDTARIKPAGVYRIFLMGGSPPTACSRSRATGSRSTA